MSQFDQQHQIPVAYPPVVALPPVGYPSTSADPRAASIPPTKSETRSRGDGFWKGCCAALCCCCVLDACF